MQIAIVIHNNAKLRVSADGSILIFKKDKTVQGAQRLVKRIVEMPGNECTFILTEL